MRKLLSAKYSEGTYHVSILVLRMGMGILMAYHGCDKIIHFDEGENSSMNFIGLGTAVSQVMVIVVELLGGILVTIGLFTRPAAIVVALWLLFVLFKSFEADIFGNGEKTALLLTGYISLSIAGSGNYSTDKIIGNKTANT